MTGAYKDNANPDNNYFMIHYSSQAAPTDGQYVFDTTTTNNAMRLDTSGNVRFKGTMEASAYYDQGGNSAGNYSRGRFIQTFSFPYKFDYTGNSRWSPLFNAPYDVTNNYHVSDAPTKEFVNKAPMAGRILRLDLTLTASEALGFTPYVYSGSSMPTASLSTSNSAHAAQQNITTPLSHDVTLGYDDFTNKATYMDFDQGIF